MIQHDDPPEWRRVRRALERLYSQWQHVSLLDGALWHQLPDMQADYVSYGWREGGIYHVRSRRRGLGAGQ